MQSILSRFRCCYVCGTTLNLHKHHIYGGNGRRERSATARAAGSGSVRITTT